MRVGLKAVGFVLGLLMLWCVTVSGRHAVSQLETLGGMVRQQIVDMTPDSIRVGVVQRRLIKAADDVKAYCRQLADALREKERVGTELARVESTRAKCDQIVRKAKAFLRSDKEVFDLGADVIVSRKQLQVECNKQAIRIKSLDRKIRMLNEKQQVWERHALLIRKAKCDAEATLQESELLQAQLETKLTQCTLGENRRDFPAPQTVQCLVNDQRDLLAELTAKTAVSAMSVSSTSATDIAERLLDAKDDGISLVTRK